MTKYDSMYVIVNIISEYSEKPSTVSMWDGMEMKGTGIFD